MTPVELLIDSPVGKLGEIEYVGVAENADGVIVFVCDIAAFIFVTRVCVVGESDGGGISHFATQEDAVVYVWSFVPDPAQ